MATDYERYRGKCKELSEQAVACDPTLTIVRGYYWCPIWGKQAHWWTIYPDGTIYDPTKDQFPSKGLGEYEPFNGMVECSQCGKEMKEKDAEFDGNGAYAFCSVRCHGRFIGVF